MKKMLLMVVFAMTALFAQAQIYVGGGIGLWHDHDADETLFSITPEVGYEFNHKWAVGAEIGYSHALKEIDDYDFTVNAFVFAPYARFSFYENKVVRLFLDMGMGVSSYKAKHHDSECGFEIGIKPGLAIKLNKNFSLVTKVGFAGYRDDYYHGADGFGVVLDGEDLSFGIEYTF